jgi:hypothetical protein
LAAVLSCIQPRCCTLIIEPIKLSPPQSTSLELRWQLGYQSCSFRLPLRGLVDARWFITDTWVLPHWWLPRHAWGVVQTTRTGACTSNQYLICVHVTVLCGEPPMDLARLLTAWEPPRVVGVVGVAAPPAGVASAANGPSTQNRLVSLAHKHTLSERQLMGSVYRRVPCWLGGVSSTAPPPRALAN